jgi:hypothetical protein
MGVGLIFLSISAMRNANSSEQEIDQAVKATLSALENGTAPAMSLLSKILSWPSKALAGWWEAVLALVAMPLDFVKGSISSASQVGALAVSTAHRLMDWIFSLPGRIFCAVMSMLGSRAQDAVNQITKTCSSLLDHASASFVGVLFHRLASSLSQTSLAIRMGCSYLSLVASKVAFEAIHWSNDVVTFLDLSLAKTSAAITSADAAILKYYAMLDKNLNKASQKFACVVVSAKDIGDRSFELVAHLYQQLAALIARMKS